MNKQELLASLAERRKVFQDLTKRSDVVSIKSIVSLLEQIEKDVQTLTTSDFRVVNTAKPRLYVSTCEDMLAISTVPGNTPMDDWDKHSIELRPDHRTLLEPATNQLRNVLFEAGIEVVMEDTYQVPLPGEQ